MATFTVTEALVKLKLGAKKIFDATAGTITGSVSTKAANVAPGGFKTVDEFKTEIKKRFESVAGLITFRDKLKKAIVESNAKTNVVVGKKTMTVAEAIETKASVENRKLLLDKLVTEWKALERDVNQKNANLEARADQYVTQLFNQNAGATDVDKANARKSFIENNTALIVTHDSIRGSIEKLKEEIEDFETNVDVALSIVNATTKVTVED